MVPSAVLVPLELRLDVGEIPTGMIPVQGQPILNHLSKKYEPLVSSKVVAVGEGGNTIKNSIDQISGEWKVIDVGDTETVGESILRTCERLPKKGIEDRPLYINFADTLIDPIKRINGIDYVSYKYADRTYRWTTFDISSDRIKSIIPKYNSISSEPRPTFVGQFGIKDISSFQEALMHATSSSSSHLDTFYTGLLKYLQNKEYELSEPKTWIDVGHIDTYHQAMKEFLNTRSFNQIEVDDKNVITKKSDDKQKLISEIDWYNQIPTELQPYLPRIYDWSTEPSNPYVRMEYIGYLSLSDLQLYSSHGQHIWNSIFHRLLEMVDDFREYNPDAMDSEIKDTLHSMYIEKTRDRLETLSEDNKFNDLFQASEIRINGELYPSLGVVLNMIPELIKNTGLINSSELSVIHGDLCFPNILYDPRNEIVKLIDPRGSFGRFTIYGDPRYDIAKLRHSVVGNYEHLINDQFQVDYYPNQPAIDYQVFTTSEQKKRMEHFDSLLSSHPDINLPTIKLIEALLFLSMIPLHDDDFARQQCMVARGLEKISYFLD